MGVAGLGIRVGAIAALPKSPLSAYPWLVYLGSLPFLSVKRGIADSTLAPEVTKHKISLVQIGPVDLYIINDYNIAKEKKIFIMHGSHKEGEGVLLIVMM